MASVFSLVIGCLLFYLKFTEVHTKSPHIVFIVADDLGWNDVGFRNPYILTPNIDRLAREGVILDQAYVQPVCTPSRNAFMTGVYPFKAGLQHLVIKPEQAVCAPENLTFLPQKLQKLGYATHMIGKWHLGLCKWECTPTFRGFDSHYGYLTGREDYYIKKNGAGFDFRNNKETLNPGKGTYSTFQYSARARELMSKHNASQPFFLYLPFQSVHEPIMVPVEYENMYKHIQNKGRRQFSGMVTAMDDAIGNVTQALKDYDLYNDTLIIFTSDNGGWPSLYGNNFPLRGSKITIYEGGTRVTSFVHGAGLKKSGYTYDGMMHAVDWNPTILSAAGGEPDSGIDGISQWENLKSNGSSPRTEFIYNLDDLAPYQNGHAAIRMGDYKLVVGYPGLYPGWYPTPTNTNAVKIREVPFDGKENNKTQLFNLKDDPNEYYDLSEELPHVVEKLRSRMAEYHAQMVPANFPKDSAAANPLNYNGYWSPGWC
ncbi:arylsulfatase B-like [Mizuhopecten yessoensis]|uniref:Arylsulfatase B n=1 Tax=Mizuhopecten yessoensis TaxID=6573 RepID=A0A210QXV8_MIZYE|nr:arylsulfatase B-like [Mizuhopecten yessoensis]OWF53589.1 Arylsulfatase B [Mizuhopecten yessoensis]